MGKWISKLFGDSSGEATSTTASSPEYVNLEKHLRRLIEIEEALGQIGAVFNGESKQSQGTSKANDPLHQISEMVNKLRVPGFIVYHLAQEGLSLLKVMAVSAALAKKNVQSSEKVSAIVTHIDEVESLFRQTLHDMEPFKSMDSKTFIESLAARMAAQKGE